MTFLPWINIAGAYVAIILCYESIGIEGFCYLSYRLCIMVNSKSLVKGIEGHWHHLGIIVFCELEQLYFDMEKMIRSSDPSHG